MICGLFRAGDMICMKGEDHVRRLFSGFRLRQFPAALAVLSLLFVFAGAAFAVTGDDTPICAPA